MLFVGRWEIKMSQATLRKALENWQDALSTWRRTAETAACRENPCVPHKTIAQALHLDGKETPETFDKICLEVRALLQQCPPHGAKNENAGLPHSRN
jgi:hypothetical protein